ncbi:MAG: hypothetical protein ABJZ55_00695 [Fuerstiella sp.]
MLIGNEESLTMNPETVQRNPAVVLSSSQHEGVSRSTLAARFEWLGQVAASLCWIASVLSYGITSSGDWFQLAAACCWLLANVASVVPRTVREKDA